MTETVRPEGRHGAGAVPRSALYARVSTSEQTPENQVAALRRYAAARGLEGTEYVDHGVSGAKEKHPQLDAMLAGARRREVDVVVVTKLDRLSRSLHHLVVLGQEFEALGVDLVVLDQAIDTTTPSGRLLFHMLAAIAEFECDLIRDRRWPPTRPGARHEERPADREARARRGSGRGRATSGGRPELA